MDLQATGYFRYFQYLLKHLNEKSNGASRPVTVSPYQLTGIPFLYTQTTSLRVLVSLISLGFVNGLGFEV